tara:strand:+ start:13080 stop:13325 length:246 start_codon:yes stop_codon:yes gene_type:complete
MKKLIVLTLFTAGLSLSSAHADAPHYTPEQIQAMPHFTSIEHQRCPSARYPSVSDRLACKHEVRVKLFEQMQQQKTDTPSQ